jgi:hypothetical protein
VARVSGGAKSAGAGSTTLPLMSLYGIAAVSGVLREVGVFNTTATNCDVKLVRLTTAGTQGASITAAPQVDRAAAPSCTLFNTHTANPTLGNDLGYRASLGAAIGSGVIWTFGDRGIEWPVGTGNGIGVIVENGTGQICQIYFVWDE